MTERLKPEPRLRGGQFWQPRKYKQHSPRGISRVHKGKVLFFVGLYPEECESTVAEFRDWIKQAQAEKV